MHVGVNPAARVEAKADRFRAAVRSAQEDLALEGDALGLARFPRQLARIDYVSRQQTFLPIADPRPVALPPLPIAGRRRAILQTAETSRFNPIFSPFSLARSGTCRTSIDATPDRVL